MERSLSALLPVCDAQTSLSSLVLDLLDVLPDLADRFDLVIVDDCSTDATIEVADELAACYPQIKAIRHATRQGRPAAIATGLANSRGRIVFLQDAECTVACDEIPRLWQEIGEHEVVLGRAGRPTRLPWTGGRFSEPKDRGGFCLFHRRAVESIQPYLENLSNLRNYLAANRLQWHEVEVRDRALQPRRQRTRKFGSVSTDRAQPQRHFADNGGLRGPNYLDRFRQFAFGE
ncbi:MAG: glycosyltransferase family 2 protein [Rhodopirellula sp.]|nr:glycosyltransferase family 2 protein [Rhodopirellula sp.]